ncbi:MAG: hypothetical protein R3B09_32815 [Nannocystaceae bacterium]
MRKSSPLPLSSRADLPPGRGRSGLRRRREGVWIAAVAAALVAACVSQPRRPASGRPLTCPDVRLPDPKGFGTSPDAVRCSYEDALGASLVHITGRVLLEQEVGPGIGVGEVNVRLAHKGPDGKPEVSHARTDAQGNFRLSGAFEADDYLVTVVDDDGNMIAHRRLEITPQMSGRLDNVTVWVPLDPRLRAGPMTPPEPEEEAPPVAAPPSTAEGPTP